ncbi:hypothetical protein [Alteromonas aestuariivivens]|uniref:hypothetical protein n=1 Tax=Alteromonas aestuariivivens TaxID=1938339 RepID=UPI0011C06952|nr:hypothetical protein [Alteromonas aestuariivivens]
MNSLINAIQHSVNDQQTADTVAMVEGLSLPISVNFEQRQQLLQALQYELAGLDDLNGSITQGMLALLAPEIQLDIAGLLAQSESKNLRVEAMNVMLLGNHQPSKLAQRISDLLENERDDDALVAMLSRIPALEASQTGADIDHLLITLMEDNSRHPSVQFHAAQSLSLLAPASLALQGTITTMLRSQQAGQRQNALNLLQHAVERHRHAGDAFQFELDSIANDHNEDPLTRIAALRVLSRYRIGNHSG